MSLSYQPQLRHKATPPLSPDLTDLCVSPPPFRAIVIPLLLPGLSLSLGYLLPFLSGCGFYQSQIHPCPWIGATVPSLLRALLTSMTSLNLFLCTCVCADAGACVRVFVWRRRLSTLAVVPKVLSTLVFQRQDSYWLRAHRIGYVVWPPSFPCIRITNSRTTIPGFCFVLESLLASRLQGMNFPDRAVSSASPSYQACPIQPGQLLLLPISWRVLYSQGRSQGPI